MRQFAIALGLLSNLTLSASSGAIAGKEKSPTIREEMRGVLQQVVLSSELVAIASEQKPRFYSYKKKVGAIEVETSGDRICNIQSHLKITRQGKLYIDEFLKTRFSEESIQESQCEFYSIGLDQIRDLDNDGEPEILIRYHTRCAHCCAGLLIYHYNSCEDRYDVVYHAFGEVGYSELSHTDDLGLKDLDGDGILEFAVLDDRFYFSNRVLINAVWQYRQGQMRNITRQFPERLRSRAEASWKEVLSLKDKTTANFYERGLIVAYLAYKYMLDERDEGWKQVQQIYQGEDREQVFSEAEKVLEGYITETITKKVEFKPDRTAYVGGFLNPNQKHLYLLQGSIGQKLNLDLKFVNYNNGVFTIRILTPNGETIGTLGNYENQNWQAILAYDGKYTIEVYSRYGANYNISFENL
ncbi:MAG: VCBS repeat-containing protein [Cyanobacteria bacterium P01_E01_bin.42]